MYYCTKLVSSWAMCFFFKINLAVLISRTARKYSIKMCEQAESVVKLLDVPLDVTQMGALDR